MPSAAASSHIDIIAAGLRYLGSDVPPQPSTIAEVLAMWQQTLRTLWRRTPEAPVEVHRQPFTREQLRKKTGFAAITGTFGAYLARFSGTA
jgi:hypothetical protein